MFSRLTQESISTRMKVINFCLYRICWWKIFNELNYKENKKTNRNKMKHIFFVMMPLSLLIAIIFNSLGLSLNHKYALASLCYTVLFFVYSVYKLCFRKWTKIKNKEFLNSLKCVNKKTLKELSFNISVVVLLFVCNICIGDIAIYTLQFYYSNLEIVYNVGSLSFDFSTFTTLFIMLSAAYQLSFCTAIKKNPVWIDSKVKEEEHWGEIKEKF